MNTRIYPTLMFPICSMLIYATRSWQHGFASCYAMNEAGLMKTHRNVAAGNHVRYGPSTPL